MKTLNKIKLQNFVDSYLATAAWVETETGECTDFTKQAKQIAKNDCKEFIKRTIERMGEDKAIELLTIPGSDLTYLAPHCFYLDRNGHGTGFWDRENDFGEDADTLSEISKSMGSIDCYHVRGPKSKLTF